MGLATKNDAAITGHGPDGSVIAERYMTGQWQHAKGEFIPERYPTNREVAKAIEQKVSVRTCCKLGFAARLSTLQQCSSHFRKMRWQAAMPSVGPPRETAVSKLTYSCPRADISGHIPQVQACYMVYHLCRVVHARVILPSE